MDSAQFLSEPADRTGVGLAVRDCGGPESQAEVSSPQSVLLHPRSVVKTLVLLSEVVPALLTDVDNGKLQVLTAPDHGGLGGNGDVDVTGQLDPLHTLRHLNTYSMKN